MHVLVHMLGYHGTCFGQYIFFSSFPIHTVVAIQVITSLAYGVRLNLVVVCKAVLRMQN